MLLFIHGPSSERCGWRTFSSKQAFDIGLCNWRRESVTRNGRPPSYGASEACFPPSLYKVKRRMERPPAYQPVCSDEQKEILEELEDKEGVSWDSKSTEIIPTNTRSFVAYMSLLLLSLSANILLVMDNAKLRIAHSPAKSKYSK